jgi:uncharacterized membrane protein YtjA (UPF0391 family)
MIDWPFLFLIIALVAGGLAVTGAAGTASAAAWIVFIVGAILVVVSLKAQGRPPVE